MAGVTIVVEVSSSFSAPKLFKVFSDFGNIAPKAEPQVYKSVAIVEGDGGVGSITSIIYGDGVPFTSSKHKTDAIDNSNLSMTWTVFEGDVLLGSIDSATHEIKFVPTAEGGSIYKHTIVFKSQVFELTEDIRNQTKQALTNTFKAIESYVIANPEAY